MKFIVISGSANYLFTRLSSVLFSSPPSSYIVSVTAFSVMSLCYTVYLYYNFSGYMDIVLGIGTLLGFDLPENFNQPFRARDFLEFWTRWHITLSLWFKTYLFNPLMSILLRSDKRPAMVPYLGVMAYFVTFGIMGLWHGTTAMFLVYGLVMGAGASIVKLWQLILMKYIGRRRTRHWEIAKRTNISPANLPVRIILSVSPVFG
jgi:alginate O-acetyltransferase complex protein AlgI